MEASAFPSRTTSTAIVGKLKKIKTTIIAPSHTIQFLPAKLDASKVERRSHAASLAHKYTQLSIMTHPV
jgi:hypothetical protein